MSEGIKKDKLTPKQQRFVAAVSTGMSGKGAVIEAGYAVSNDNSAKAMAHNMLTNDKIQLALAHAISIDLPNITRTRVEYRDWETDRKSTRLNSSHLKLSRMPSSA